MGIKKVKCSRTCPGRIRGCTSDLEDMERFQCPLLLGTNSRKYLEDEEASTEDELVGVFVCA
ncbi:hypothetical protein KKC44_05640 [Patescibacteria group bacterium]|nr:hypothetical protein [Patescibacteria group bacterium]MBU2260056.1 hypothetical protein [Patescibacteria group bacterium]